jgi:hypothetical protein
MKKSRPYMQDGDKEILGMGGKSLSGGGGRKISDWEDHVEVEADTYNQVVGKLAANPAKRDPFMEVQTEMLAKPKGKGKCGGYLRAAGAEAPNTLGSDEAPLDSAPSAVSDDPHKLVQEELLNVTQHKGAGYLAAGYLGAGEFQPDKKNAVAFYKSLHAHLGGAEYATKKMSKLFGSGWPKYSKSKVGGAVKGGLKIGHLVAPVMKGHLVKALKGSGIDPEEALAYLEEDPQMAKRVTPKYLASGGSVLGSIWATLKRIFTSEGAKKIYKELGKKALEFAATKGKDYLLDYVESHMGGAEPCPKLKGGYATHGGAEGEAPAPAPKTAPAPVSIPIPKATPAEMEAMRKPTKAEIKDAKDFVKDYIDAHGALAGGSKAGWKAFWSGFKKGFTDTWKFLVPIVMPVIKGLIGIGMEGGMVGGPDSLPPWVKLGVSHQAWVAQHKAIGEGTPSEGMPVKKKVRKGGAWTAEL